MEEFSCKHCDQNLSLTIRFDEVNLKNFLFNLFIPFESEVKSN